MVETHAISLHQEITITHKLSNSDLHLGIKKFARQEKANTVEVLNGIREIHKRKLFIDYGYSTLMNYVIGELGYSESEAWTRISAMKLIDKCPEAEIQMIQGDLTISNAATINDSLRKDQTQNPKTLIEAAKGKPNRQLKRELNPDKKEKRILLSERILKKMQKLLGAMSEVELIESLLDEKLKALEVSKTRTSKEINDSKKSRYIQVAVRKVIFERSGHQCEHLDKSGKHCSERRNLQYDHIQPFALGGDRSVNNLRMLCCGHNQRRAYETFMETPGEFQSVFEDQYHRPDLHHSQATS